MPLTQCRIQGSLKTRGKPLSLNLINPLILNFILKVGLGGFRILGCRHSTPTDNLDISPKTMSKSLLPVWKDVLRCFKGASRCLRISGGVLKGVPKVLV